MGLEMDVRKRSNAKMQNPSFVSNSNYNDELEAELMKYTYNDSKVDKPLTEQTKEAGQNASGEVDMIDCTRPGANDPVEVQCQDTTESSSSSFGNSDFDNDNLGDDALSSFNSDAEFSALDFHFHMLARKKQLTPHWKAFIKPVMWRCKWAELQIKKFEAQARKYEGLLVKYDQQKHIELENSAPENIAANMLLRRKKRRKTETTTDLAAHMSNHNLFSYYEKKIRNNGAASRAKIPAKAIQKAKVVAKIEIDESSCDSGELSWAKPKDDDYPMEQMLRKIVSLESRVKDMRGRVSKVITANSGKFSEAENLSSLLPNSAAPQYNTALPSNGGGANAGSSLSSQYMAEPYASDAYMKGVPSTSYTQDVPDSPQEWDLASFANALRNGRDGVLSEDWRVEQEPDDFDAMMSWLMETPLVINDQPGGSSTALEEEPDLPFEDEMTHEVRSVAAPDNSTGRRGRRSTRRKGAGRGTRR